MNRVFIDNLTKTTNVYKNFDERLDKRQRRRSAVSSIYKLWVA
jgi:hypothetical protein